MKTVYNPKQLEKYLQQGEKCFLAGNEKMKLIFKVYGTLGCKERSGVIEKGASVSSADVSRGLAAAGITGINVLNFFAVLCSLSGRSSTVIVKPDGNVEVDVH